MARDKRVEAVPICETEVVNQEAVARARRGMLTPEETVRLAETFKALGDVTRIKLLHTLSHQELCVCDLAAVLDLGQSAVSHQLRILRNLRLVKFRKAGKSVYYSLDDRHIVELFQDGLEHVRHG